MFNVSGSFLFKLIINKYLDRKKRFKDVLWQMLGESACVIVCLEQLSKLVADGKGPS